MFDFIRKFKNTIISLATLIITIIVNSFLNYSDIYYAVIYEYILVLIALIVIIKMYFTALLKERTLLAFIYLLFITFNYFCY